MNSRLHSVGAASVVTAFAVGLLAGGCGRKTDGAESSGRSVMGARPAPMQRAMAAEKEPVPSRRIAMAPVPPARRASVKRLAPLPWPPPKTKAPGRRTTCRTLCGTKEKGSFFDKCTCKGKGLVSPLVARKTSTYHKFFKRYEFEVCNRSGRPIEWASANLFYYDTNGKQLTVVIADPKGKDKPRVYERYRVNGSNFTVPPNTTKMITLGWSKDEEPKATARVEVVFDGWCYGKRHPKTNKVINQLCIRIKSPPPKRPMSRPGDVFWKLMAPPGETGVHGLGRKVPRGDIRATIQAHTAKGPLAADTVRRTVGRRLRAIARCHRPTLGGPKLPGTVKATFTINARGTVTQAKPSGGTISLPAARSCVLRILRGLRFPSRTGRSTKGSVTFHVAFPPK